MFAFNYRNQTIIVYIVHDDAAHKFFFDFSNIQKFVQRLKPKSRIAAKRIECLTRNYESRKYIFMDQVVKYLRCHRGSHRIVNYIHNYVYNILIKYK
ncbi:hypothetical protein [Ectropis obliqua nucleopolyhedrovirus]|uniref:Uncharacterized protein n=1 Tax=Ectropis obliqua nucleopolyhedrovirus TaxID=59376 RepID=A0EYS6_9ABAC|nr:hypothetical protein EONV_gp023 [Ectropis obliqua nucleopolyhedrovirus]ABI35706.1 hypothetical protein [Ectropis obliqua nucleopolyhedrovirus]QWV59609.1 hypothetical protein EONV_gp023 [Ectropis obliqua nucleopolyhedrovirus]UYO72815.1 hypothetical protein EONV-gp023 [Ectropis obliqua nucleopolyhedrovirus]